MELTVKAYNPRDNGRKCLSKHVGGHIEMIYYKSEYSIRVVWVAYQLLTPQLNLIYPLLIKVYYKCVLKEYLLSSTFYRYPLWGYF